MAMIIYYNFYLIQMEKESLQPDQNMQNNQQQRTQNNSKLTMQDTQFQHSWQPQHQDSSLQSQGISHIRITEIIRLNEIQQYCVYPNLLLGTNILQLQRAKLRSWISRESSKRNLSRKTTSISNMLIDLYFSKGGTVSLQQYHALGISSLLLANKLNQNKIILIDHSVFPLNELNELEIQLCFKLQFRVNPITYIHLMDQILIAWNQFAQKYQDGWMYMIGNLKQKIKDIKIMGCRKFYQLLDAIYLNIQTYSCSSISIVLQVFKQLFKNDYDYLISQPKSIEDQVIISFWHTKNQCQLFLSDYNSIFKKFISFLNISTQFNLKNIQLQNYITSFIMHGFQESQMINEQNTNESYYQTYNNKGYAIIKKNKEIQRKRLNIRKSSGETTF